MSTEPSLVRALGDINETGETFGARAGLPMTAKPSLVSQLDEALRSSSSDKRVEVLRRVTDLFLNHSAVLADEQVEVFDDVLGRMIKHIESKVLAELGHLLAPVDNAPGDVIRRLAM